MSAKQPRYELADKAHKKLLLHAFKYPQHSVNGVLIGKPQDTSDSAKSKSIVIADYIPLFHGCTLSPMLEGAMMLVDEYCKANNLVVVGYFHANEHFDNSELSPLTHRIANKINKHFPQSCILLFDPVRAKSKEPTVAVKGFVRDGDKWQEKNANFESEGSIDWSHLEAMIKESSCKLQDFDNHLDDPSNDFFNEHLFSSKC